MAYPPGLPEPHYKWVVAPKGVAKPQQGVDDQERAEFLEEWRIRCAIHCERGLKELRAADASADKWEPWSWNWRALGQFETREALAKSKKNWLEEQKRLRSM